MPISCWWRLRASCEGLACSGPGRTALDKVSPPRTSSVSWGLQAAWEIRFRCSSLEMFSEELERHCAVAGQVPLQSIDVFIAVNPEVAVDLDVGDPLGLDQLRMDSDDEDFLVIGAVEDAIRPLRAGPR